MTDRVFIGVLTKDLLVCLTCTPTSPPTSPSLPPYTCRTTLPDTHTFAPTSHPHHTVAAPPLYINTAAFLSEPHLLLPFMPSVMLRASQEMNFIMLESIFTHTRACTQTHREKKQNFLKRLSGARQALNLTHTYFFRRTIKTVSTPLPQLPAIGNGNFRISGSGAIRIPCRAPKQCSYFCSEATNVVKPLIRSLKQLALAD